MHIAHEIRIINMVPRMDSNCLEAKRITKLVIIAIRKQPIWLLAYDRWHTFNPVFSFISVFIRPLHLSLSISFSDLPFDFFCQATTKIGAPISITLVKLIHKRWRIEEKNEKKKLEKYIAANEDAMDGTICVLEERRMHTHTKIHIWNDMKTTSWKANKPVIKTDWIGWT